MNENKQISMAVTPRLLNKKQAAAYCGVSVPTFDKSCPVSPAELYSGVKRYDRKTLDAWIDSLSQAGRRSSFDAALDELDRK
jgi:hypothetical protein